jgi:hypothetical protein
MKLFDLIQVFVFLFLIVVGNLLYTLSGYDFGTDLELFVPKSFAAIYLVAAIISSINSKKEIAQIYFLISLLSFLVFLKIHYFYYNILVAFLILVTAIIFYKQKLIIGNFLLLFFIGLNLLLLISSDSIILKYHLPNKFKSWTPTVEWEDFHGEKPSSIYSASIFTSRCYQVNKVYNFPPAIFLAVMNQRHSWVGEDEKTDRLLKHEQGHFDLREYMTRQIKDSISRQWGMKPSKIIAIIESFYRYDSIQQTLYDTLTSHGRDTVVQKRYDSMIDFRLR